MKYQHFLLCVQDSTVAVIHACNGFYYLLNSHSRNSAVFPVSNGSAVLLSFMLLTNLQTYVTSLAVQLNASTFELTPLNIRADIQPLEMKAGFAQQGKTIHIGVFAYTGKHSNYYMMDKYFTQQLQYSRLKSERNTLQRERMMVNKSQNVETHYRKNIIMKRV